MSYLCFFCSNRTLLASSVHVSQDKYYASWPPLQGTCGHTIKYWSKGYSESFTSNFLTSVLELSRCPRPLPRNCIYDLIWREGFCRHNEVKDLEVRWSGIWRPEALPLPFSLSPVWTKVDILENKGEISTASLGSWWFWSCHSSLHFYKRR